MESMRVLGRLDDTAVIFTADHGHSIGDGNYMGKRGYPSSRDVYDVPLMVRFPGAANAGLSADLFVQHQDITAEVLRLAGLDRPAELDGACFLDDAIAGRPSARDHATVGWGSAATVVNDRWWFNGKLDGTGVLLHDLSADEPFARNVADDHPRAAREMFDLALADAKGGVPQWIVDLARNQADAPGCSDLAARA